ncbi:hypothetical protein EB796_025235 [Bugula neritina]|uniref:Receptor ligand binding region domain-containing protein n=1 Tax=Bugula neritina TaxID=10212 RepID=A0A7J7IST1_BUGNE|nr:hypothetical protein EB796_025235 [Bugula neritina]
MKLLLGFGLLYLFALLCEPSESQSCGLRSVVPVSQAHIIYVSNEDEYCKPGSVAADSASVDSAKEILQSINMNSSLSFGLQVLPLCHLNQITRVQIGAKILQQLPPVDQCQPTIPENSTSSLIGVIAPFHLNLQDVLGETDIPLVTLGETSANDESAENVFYTSNSLIFRAKAMAQLAVKLNWDYTTVAYGSDPVSHELKALLEDELKANLICVDEYFEFSDTSAACDIASRISNDAKPKAVIVIGLKNGVTLNHDRSDSLEWIVSPHLPESKPLQYLLYRKTLFTLYSTIILMQCQSP